MTMTRVSALFTLLAPLALLPACRGDDGGASATEASSSSSTSDGTDSASSTSGVSESDTGTSTTTMGETSSDVSSAGFLTTQGSTSNDTGVMPQPNGSQCGSDAECESMKCYSIPMVGGVCSECKVDADCLESGEGIACSLDLLTMQAACSNGQLGDTCMAMSSCEDGLFCAEVVEGTFGLVPSACSNCKSSGDCDGGQLCAPIFDTMKFEGYKDCVEPGSVQNDALCSIKDMGDASCASGHCGEVDIMGFIQVGVCGACNSDEDCEMDQKCMPGVFDQGSGFKGSTCG